MEKINVRRIQVSEVFNLQKIGEETFLEAFGEYNTKADMDTYLNESFNIERLKTELNNPNSLFYFAETDKAVVGYLKVNLGEAQTDNQLNDALEVERIYVLKGYYGHGVGKILLEKAFKIAKQQEVTAIWLGVWEHNSRAIRFYEKHGFTVFGKHGFTLGEDKQTDILMKLDLIDVIN